jgi:hypothetical protein
MPQGVYIIDVEIRTNARPLRSTISYAWFIRRSDLKTWKTEGLR